MTVHYLLVNHSRKEFLAFSREEPQAVDLDHKILTAFIERYNPGEPKNISYYGDSIDEQSETWRRNNYQDITGEVLQGILSRYKLSSQEQKLVSEQLRREGR
ncbi:hypothetical protein HZC30_05650 [Candidatus Woesearchaeota archaeon]|nr:hypothetical protein [Candidatus Woesearchaeota archaeon]